MVILWTEGLFNESRLSVFKTNQMLIGHSIIIMDTWSCNKIFSAHVSGWLFCCSHFPLTVESSYPSVFVFVRKWSKTCMFSKFLVTTGPKTIFSWKLIFAIALCIQAILNHKIILKAKMGTMFLWWFFHTFMSIPYKPNEVSMDHSCFFIDVAHINNQK